MLCVWEGYLSCLFSYAYGFPDLEAVCSENILAFLILFLFTAENQCCFLNIFNPFCYFSGDKSLMAVISHKDLGEERSSKIPQNFSWVL